MPIITPKCPDNYTLMKDNCRCKKNKPKKKPKKSKTKKIKVTKVKSKTKKNLSFLEENKGKRLYFKSEFKKQIQKKWKDGLTTDWIKRYGPNTDTRNFIMHLREKVPKKYMKGILGGKTPKCWDTHLYSKLYGFDNYKKHKFIKLYFKNIKTMKKVRGLWYENYPNHGILKPFYQEAPYRGRKLKIY